MGKIAVYWKAIIAFSGALGAFLLGISTNSSIAEAVSPGVLASVGAAATVLTGIGTWAKGNATPAVKGEKAVEVVTDAVARIEEARAAQAELEKRATTGRKALQDKLGELLTPSAGTLIDTAAASVRLS